MSLQAKPSCLSQQVSPCIDAVLFTDLLNAVTETSSNLEPCALLDDLFTSMCSAQPSPQHNPQWKFASDPSTDVKIPEINLIHIHGV